MQKVNSESKIWKWKQYYWNQKSNRIRENDAQTSRSRKIFSKIFEQIYIASMFLILPILQVH